MVGVLPTEERATDGLGIMEGGAAALCLLRPELNFVVIGVSIRKAAALSFSASSIAFFLFCSISALSIFDLWRHLR
jgi:hypothetical protein